MEEDDEYCSNPTQSTDDNEEAIMRENAGFFMTQNQCKCNHTKNLEILQHNHQWEGFQLFSLMRDQKEISS